MGNKILKQKRNKKKAVQRKDKEEREKKALQERNDARQDTIDKVLGKKK